LRAYTQKIIEWEDTKNEEERDISKIEKENISL